MIWMKGYYFHKPRFVRSGAGKRVGFGFFRWLVYWRQAAKAVASEGGKND